MQHMKLYEFSVSMKLLLTGFIILTCVAGVLALLAAHDYCRGADGNYGSFSIEDIHITLGGSDTPILLAAVERPDQFGLGGVSPDNLAKLRVWCEAGAPFRDFEEMRNIIRHSGLDLPSRSTPNRQYAWLRSLALRHDRLSSGALMGTIGLYGTLVGLVFLGLGMMFVRSSLFEKTKVFVVSSAFAFAVLLPVFLWQARDQIVFVYLMLLSLLLLVLCFAVFALVSLTDIWFRRNIT
jgi:hypothetical protein